MPPRSPLPQRQGLGAAWIRTPDRDPAAPPSWVTMRDFLVDRLPDGVPVAERLANGEFVDQAGRAWTGDEPYTPHTFIWFHRPVRPEPEVPYAIEVLYADDRIVVVDKPHFLATTPNGTHVRQTVLVRLRDSLGLPELTPVHRLDRLTAGVLVLTTQREHRGVYGDLFQSRSVRRSTRRWPRSTALELPRRVANRIEKRRGACRRRSWREPNAETLVECVEVRGPYARYRLTPITGRPTNCACTWLAGHPDPRRLAVPDGRRGRGGRLHHAAAARCPRAALHRSCRRASRVRQPVCPRLARHGTVST